MSFHILGLPHTITSYEYSSCAFTTKTVKMCDMLHEEGLDVYHYGHERSAVKGTNVPVTFDDTLRDCYGEWNWGLQSFPDFKWMDAAHKTFVDNAVDAVRERCSPGDFLLCMWGAAHKPIVDRLEGCGLAVVEPGIGYANDHFAPYKAFESYAMLHAYLGLQRVKSASNQMWYDVVIPNYYNLDEFEYREKKDDYLLHISRLGFGKGTHIAAQVAKATGRRLVVAGVGGDDALAMMRQMCPAAQIDYRGVVGPAERRELLAGAYATLCPSTYVEPFCGVQVESLLSGTPVISTDWGAFTEIIENGRTGYRCRTMRQFLDAVDDVGTWCKPEWCREAGMRYDMRRVVHEFTRFFHDIEDVVLGRGGWYA